VVQMMTTALGRSVPQDDWKSLHVDTILKLLYGVSTSPFNPNDEPVEIGALVQATGLDVADIRHLIDDHYLIDAMEAGGLVEVTKDSQGKPTAVRLSPRGRQWISFRLAHPAEANGSIG
jgi:hypothetical protein